MKFANKLSFTILATGIIILSISSIMVFKFSLNSVVKSQLVQTESIAHEVSDNLDLLLFEKIKIGLTLANASIIKKALETSNFSYHNLSDEKREESIKLLNDQWKSTKDSTDKFILKFTDNKTSHFLKLQQEILKGEYGEIFLTNKFGALVASTSKLSTFAHGHKYWWLGAYSNGEGAVFFDDRGYDASVGGYVLGLVIPIREGNEVIGILKSNLNILGNISELINSTDDSLFGTFKLIRSGGMVVFEKGCTPLSTQIHDDIFRKIKSKNIESFIIKDATEKYIVGFSEVKLTKGEKGYGFGGTFESIDHEKGNTGESWYVLCYRNLSVIKAPIIESIKWLILIIAIMLLILVFVSYLFGKKLALPLKMLNKATEKIGKGEFEYKIDIRQNDEFGNLAHAFNNMADKLYQTTTTLDILENEVANSKQLTKQLQESESFAQSVMDNLPIGVAVNSVNPNVNFDYMNDNFPRVYCTTREALADPNDFWESVYEDPDYREEIKKKILDDCASGDLERMNWENVPITRKGEATVFISARNTPIPDKHLMISTVWDVTALKQAEVVLKKQTHDIGERNKELKCLYSILTLLDDQDILAEEIFQRTVDLIPHAWQYPDITCAQMTINNKQYKTENFEPSNWKQYSDILIGGKHTGIVAVYYLKEMPLIDEGPFLKEERDLIDEIAERITIFIERKETEEKNSKLEFQLRQSQKMESIGTLAGGISHDFNNILFPILGHAEMLLEDVHDDSPFKESLNEIYTSALRAKDLVKQILTFSRQESNELKLMKMQPIIREALMLIRSTIPTTIEIRQDIQTKCGVIKADPTQIHQIVMNIATNAYHAMEATGGELLVKLKEIELGTLDLINPDMPPGVYACLTIADTGEGMDKDLIEKVFDPFFTTKAIGKGTGMGLSVVHGIVANMKGAIKILSEPGKGTEFNVYLPVEKSISAKPVTRSKTLIQGGSEHILLVDDEKTIITMEQKMLERLGYKVTSHISSIEALEFFRDSPNKFNLVITDMQMPNMSGDKFAVELAKIRPDIPILLCTGFSETISEERAASLGINGFLLKPIVKQDLSHKIREVLDAR